MLQVPCLWSSPSMSSTRIQLCHENLWEAVVKVQYRELCNGKNKEQKEDEMYAVKDQNFRE